MRFLDEQFIAALKENKAGAKMTELPHKHGISDEMFSLSIAQFESIQ